MTVAATLDDCRANEDNSKGNEHALFSVSGCSSKNEFELSPFHPAILVNEGERRQEDEYGYKNLDGLRQLVLSATTDK
jgi:hypothetical protein